MNYRNLGSTGLKVSVVGLGCGGPSRLGQRDGKSPDHSVNLVRKALDLGVNLLDTAETYGTEEIVGAALRDVPRDRVVLSAKKTLPEPDDPDPAGTIRSGLDASLKRLGTDYVDIYHLHGVGDARYDFAANVLAPVVTGLKEAGKIRAVGITEEFPANPRHQMLAAGPARPLVGRGHGRLQSAEPVGAPKRVPSHPGKGRGHAGHVRRPARVEPAGAASRSCCGRWSNAPSWNPAPTWGS